MNHTDPKTNDDTNDDMQENDEDDASQEQVADDDDSHAYSDDAYENDATGDGLQFQVRIGMPCLQEQIRVSS